MSTTALGHARVGKVRTFLSALGYRTMKASVSGRSSGKRRDENPIPGDLLGWAREGSGLPHVLVEVGGVGKRLRTAFAELEKGGLPGGHVAVVVRVVRRRWWYYVSPTDRFGSIGEALYHAARG